VQSETTEALVLALWINGLTDKERLNLLVYLCGWKPEIIATLKAEAEDDA
jgi:hypothetical protein